MNLCSLFFFLPDTDEIQQEEQRLPDCDWMLHTAAQRKDTAVQKGIKSINVSVKVGPPLWKMAAWPCGTLCRNISLFNERLRTCTSLPKGENSVQSAPASIFFICLCDILPWSLWGLRVHIIGQGGTVWWRIWNQYVHGWIWCCACSWIQFQVGPF